MYKKATKIIFVSIGFISLTIGIIGIAVPILPSTPFFLLTLFCFAKGSERFHKWFLSTSLYKKHLHSFATHRALKMKSKITILLSTTALLAIPFIIVNSLHLRIFLLVLITVKAIYFFKFVKTLPKDNKADVVDTY